MNKQTEVKNIVNERVLLNKTDGITTLLKHSKYWIDIETFHKINNTGIIQKSEMIYSYINNIKTKPICICGSNKFLKFTKITKGYNQFCSGNCPASIENRKQSIKEKNLKMGYSNKETKEKIENTLQKKYGVINPSKLSNHKEKIKQTSLEKFGETNYSKTTESKDRIRKTSLEKYGVKNHSQLHYIDETKNIMENENINWIDFVKQNGGIQTTADKLKVNYKTIWTKIKEYDPEYKISKSTIEDAIELILIDNNINYIKNNRSVIKPYELDFYIPEHNFAIEYNSFKYHTDDNPHIDRNYHKNKTDLCRDRNIQLLHIFQDEWFLKQNIVKNKILNLCGKSQKGIAARKCTIHKIDWTIAKQFMNEFHIQGSGSGSTVSYGCYSEDALIGVMTFIYQNNEWILNRFASDGKSNPGMASKILKYFIRDYNPEKIVSFADLRYSYGDLYNKLGFTMDKMLKPEYSYVKGSSLYNKRQFRKDKFKNYFRLDIKGKTEKELSIELGLKRIWDCGKIRYIWNKK